MKGTLVLSFLVLFSLTASATDSVVSFTGEECPNGYVPNYVVGFKCVQENCYDIEHAHYSSGMACICGTSGSIAEKDTDPNKECSYPQDYEACPGCIYACVHFDEECPLDKAKEEEFVTPLVQEDSVVEEAGENDTFLDLVVDFIMSILGVSGEENQTNVSVGKVEKISWMEKHKNEGVIDEPLNYSSEELDENGCSPVETVKSYRDFLGNIITLCACNPGYRQTDNGCIFDKPLLNISAEDLKQMELVLRNLGSNEHDFFEILFRGKIIRVGVLRRSDQSLEYTVDGKRWKSNIDSLIDPGFLERSSEGIGILFSSMNPVNWFHTSYKDEDKELKWEVASTTLEAYKKDIAKPQNFWLQVDGWYKFADDKVEAAKKLRDYGILPGTFDVTRDKIVGSVSGYAQGFPAEAVKKMFSELQTDDFAQAVSTYISYRQTMSPQQIASNPPEDLEFAISAGTASSFGEVLLYQKYEEAYQRYQMRKSIPKQ